MAIAGLAIIATALIITIALACLKRKNIIITEHVAYLSKNEEYTIPASANEAYGIATAINEENDIASFTNDPYVATDVSTSPNQTYETAKYSSSSNSITYDYAYDYIPHTT